MERYDICPSCFKPMNGNNVCRYCGYDSAKEKKYAGVLNKFTTLNNRYTVGKVLGRGGFGITYVAKDVLSGELCAIKEYMPSEFSSRVPGSQAITPFSDNKAKGVFEHGREKFILEARTLIKLKNNTTVVNIRDFFEQNNTAYLVMDYLDGENLREKARKNGGKLDPGFAKTVLAIVASSLMEIHRLNILHRDLSPENIFCTKDNDIKLIDFGAARNYVASQNKGMSILIKPGFAPPEQYNVKGRQGPWTDVYALCATFYNLVSGKRIVDALFRARGEKQPSLWELGCGVSKKTSDVIEKGMELDYRKRYKDFKELLDDIDIETVQVKPKDIKEDVHSTVPMPSENNSNSNANNYLNNRNVRVHKSEVYNIPDGNSEFVNTLKTSDEGNTVLRPYVAAVINNRIVNCADLEVGKDMTMGRSRMCQYPVSGDMNISRSHCSVRFDGKKIFLKDVSANGTFFEDGRRLVLNKEYEVSPGERFYLVTRNHLFTVNEK